MPDEQESNDSLPEHVRETVSAISRMHDDHRRGGTRTQRTAARITGWAASSAVIAWIIIASAAWIILNLSFALRGLAAPDPPPFFWIQGVVSFLALLMTALILTTQRREDQLTELRQQLILELALLIEQKAAKTLERLESLRRDLPSVENSVDPAADALSQPADTQAVAAALQEPRLGSADT